MSTTIPGGRSAGHWRRAAMLLAFLATFGAGCAGHSSPSVQPGAFHDWAGISLIQMGAALKVESVSNASMTGRLLAVDPDRLTLATRRGEVTMQRTEIRRIITTRRQRGQNARWGFGTGALAGLLVGTLTTGSNRATWGAFLAAAWGGLGALIGALTSESSEVVIYLAPTVFSSPRPP